MRHTNPDASTDTPTDPELAIDTPRTAKILGIATITLHQMRARGGGPPFFRCGTRTVRYRLGDVLAYRDARTVGGGK